MNESVGNNDGNDSDDPFAGENFISNNVISPRDYPSNKVKNHWDYECNFQKLGTIGENLQNRDYPCILLYKIKVFLLNTHTTLTPFLSLPLSLPPPPSTACHRPPAPVNSTHRRQPPPPQQTTSKHHNILERESKGSRRNPRSRCGPLRKTTTET
ncbi:hypothetical protein HanIR_Chr07g0317541 [Helianthus annuus]|nr:hypothetical protein HanIR_Chr07g0317541 [Helianthus annuus]